MNDSVRAANSGSCPTGQAPAGLVASRCDPGRELLAKVIDYYEGRKPFDFHRLPADQRGNEAFDAWQLLAEEIRVYLQESA